MVLLRDKAQIGKGRSANIILMCREESGRHAKIGVGLSKLSAIMSRKRNDFDGIGTENTSAKRDVCDMQRVGSVMCVVEAG